MQSVCDGLKAQAEQKYAGGIEQSIETSAACLRLCAEGLSRLAGDGSGSYPMQDISLLIACSAVSGGWKSVSSADRERIAERLKLYVSSVNGLCTDLPFSLTVPGYASIERNCMTPPQLAVFTAHLAEIFRRLSEEERMAVLLLHDCMLYAVFEQWPQVDVLTAAYREALRSPDPAAQAVAFPGSTAAGIPPSGSAAAGTFSSGSAAAGTFSSGSAAAPSPSSKASTAAIARYERNAQRRWRPLKLYLIITGLFVALVLGLYFYAAPAFEEGQAVVVKDAAGQTVKLLPDSEPVELALVGRTDYNGVIRLFYTTVIGLVIYRVAAIAVTFILNALYRKRNAKKAAALRAGSRIP